MGDGSRMGSIHISMLLSKLGGVMKTLTVHEYTQKQVERIRLTLINNPNKVLARAAPNKCMYCELREEAGIWKL